MPPLWWHAFEHGEAEANLRSRRHQGCDRSGRNAIHPLLGPARRGGPWIRPWRHRKGHPDHRAAHVLQVDDDAHRSPSVAGRVPCACREWPDAVREVSSERRDRVHGNVVQGEVTMATKVGTLPNTMPSPETGETLTRGVRPFRVTYKGKTITVDLPGYYPKGDGDGVHVGNDMSVVYRALRMLKEKEIGRAHV